MSPMRRFAIMAGLLAVGCSPEILNPIDDIGGEEVLPPGDQTPAETPDSGTRLTRKNLTGTVTWNVTFDETAKAAGATDCSYTRRYTGVENASRPWQCPSCEARFEAGVELIAGLDDCYTQVSDATPAPTEWLGYGGGPWFRGPGALLAEQGTATLTGATLHVENSVQDIEASVGGLLAFEVSGDLLLGEENGDPQHEFYAAEGYSCGWNQADTAPYDGDYVLEIGGLLPDGIFKDRCEDNVRLHDFAGSYLVVNMGAMDCPPCRSMAAVEDMFVEELAAEGIDVHVITLLAPSLSDTLGETTTAMLDEWTLVFDLHSPVLADRGWGLSVFAPAIGDETGYPSWTIVAPDLTVLEFGTGFGTFQPFATTIRNHHAASGSR